MNSAVNIPENMKATIDKHALFSMSNARTAPLNVPLTIPIWGFMIRTLAEDAGKDLDDEMIGNCVFKLGELPMVRPRQRYHLAGLSSAQLPGVFAANASASYFLTRTIGTSVAELLLEDSLTPESLAQRVMQKREGGSEDSGPPAPLPWRISAAAPEPVVVRPQPALYA